MRMHVNPELGLLENFDDITILKDCFDFLFSGENREAFLKNTIIKSSNNIDTSKKIRESMQMFHTDAEDSGDEYGLD